MADPQMVPPDGWAGPTSLLASTAALITAIWKGRSAPKKDDLHNLRNKVGANELKTAVLEARYGDIDRRLSSIEAGLQRVLEKVDDALRQR